MSGKSGTNLDKNPFAEAMNSSIANAAEISEKVLTALQSQQLTDSRIADLVTYYDPINQPFQDQAALQTSDVIVKVASTKKVVTTVKGMSVQLKSWIKQIANVYDEGTDDYNRLLIGGTKSFYSGSRTKRLIRVNALIVAIGTDPLLATVLPQIQAYSDKLSKSIASQTSNVTTVGAGSSDINDLRDDCTKGLWYVYCGLIMIFIDTPSKALKFFPMEFIYNAANMITHTMMVPAHTLKKICIHTFKLGETVTLTNNLVVPIKVGLALDAKATVLLWYTVFPGEPVTITPDKLGNILYKYIMTENDDLLIAGDITFTINAAA